jgi:DNA-binding CsgD family transcriptional regulator
LRDHHRVTLLAEGRACFDRGAWAEACAALSAADREASLEPEDLDRLATAAYLAGRDAESAAARARAYDAFLTRDEPLRAAASAFWLAFATLDKRDRHAEAGGWLARARRLVDECGEECAERGFLLCASAVQAAGGGRGDAAHAMFVDAAALGVRFHNRDLLTLARHGQGRALVGLGRHAEGLALLDEVMLDVTRGGVAPMVAGVVYCSAISTCRDLFDWRRAQEWTAALADWCVAQPDLVPFRGVCLVRRSEVMQLGGAWSDALEEARRACARLTDPPGQADAGLAHYQLAELYRLRGDFDRADEHYRLASQAGTRLDAGLALLRLSQGRVDAALAAIRRALQETTSRRHRVPILSGAVEITLAAGDIDAAREAADELARLATDLGSPFVEGTSAAAAGAVALASGDVPAALTRLAGAAAAWRQLDVPYELARVRALVGVAYRQMGDREGAALEFDAAQETFDRLGAAPDAARVAALAAANAPPVARCAGLTGREVEVLRLVATGRTNRAIAADLGISEKTVARHLSNIFTKLDLPSRTAATAYAYEHKLV